MGKFSFFSILSHKPTSSGMAVLPPQCFSLLLMPNLCASIDVFISVYRDGINLSQNLVPALTRFLVESITVNKHTKEFYEHEYISIQVLDKETQLHHSFFIERQGVWQFWDSGASHQIPSPASDRTNSHRNATFIRKREHPISPSESLEISRPVKRTPSLYSIKDKLTLASTRLVHINISLTSSIKQSIFFHFPITDAIVTGALVIPLCIMANILVGQCTRCAMSGA
jgi:hypothetical protein